MWISPTPAVLLVLQPGLDGHECLALSDINNGIRASPCCPPSSWKISLRCPSRPPSPQTHVNRRPFSICNKPSSVAFREIISYTPIPLMDTTVESRLRSVRACITCATHSRPARVDCANWRRAVAASASVETCCAVVRATKRRRMSPTTVHQLRRLASQVL